jgi:hypothetical protein
MLFAWSSFRNASFALFDCFYVQSGSNASEDDDSDHVGTQQLSKKNEEGSRAQFDLFDDGRRLEAVQNDDGVEWVKKSDRTWPRGLPVDGFGAQSRGRDGNRGSDKRKWKNSGMQWIKRNIDNYDRTDDADGSFEEDGDETSDDYDGEMQNGINGEETKRRWGNSPMGWMKRKWGNSGMGWIKRRGDKRRWKNSNMQWVKK